MSSPSLVAPLLLVSIALGTMHGAEIGPSDPTAPAAPTSARALSEENAAKLVASLPKVVVTNPAEKKGPTQAAADLRETDKPANTIVRLPKYVVHEARPPEFREQDLYNRGDLARRLAKRYYPEGYLAFSRLVQYTPLALFLPSAEASALAQFEEDERLRNKAEYTDYANMLLRSNAAAGAKFKGDVQAFFMHWSDLGWSSSK